MKDDNFDTVHSAALREAGGPVSLVNRGWIWLAGQEEPMMTTGNAILPSVLSVKRDIDRAGFGDGKGVYRRTVFPPGETPRLYGRRVARRHGGNWALLARGIGRLHPGFPMNAPEKVHASSSTKATEDRQPGGAERGNSRLDWIRTGDGHERTATQRIFWHPLRGAFGFGTGGLRCTPTTGYEL